MIMRSTEDLPEIYLEKMKLHGFAGGVGELGDTFQVPEDLGVSSSAPPSDGIKFKTQITQ